MIYMMYWVLLKSYCVLNVLYVFVKKKKRNLKLFYILTVNIKVDIYIIKKIRSTWDLYPGRICFRRLDWFDSLINKLTEQDLACTRWRVKTSLQPRVLYIWNQIVTAESSELIHHSRNYFILMMEILIIIRVYVCCVYSRHKMDASCFAR